MDKRKALVFGSAAAIRLLLFTAFPALPDVLTARAEISTPVTSFKRRTLPLTYTFTARKLTDVLPPVVQEGVFLYTHNVSPYDGGVFHQAPLLLPLFSLLPDSRTTPLPTSLAFIALDLLGAHALYQIAESGASSSMRLFTSPRKGLRYSPSAVAAAYVCHGQKPVARSSPS